MQFTPLRVGRVRVAVATSTALVLIVAAVLAWIGLRMSEQEMALSKAMSVVRLNFSADAFLKDFQLHVGKTEDNLFQVDGTTSLPLVARTSRALSSETRCLCGLPLQISKPTWLTGHLVRD